MKEHGERMKQNDQKFKQNDDQGFIKTFLLIIVTILEILGTCCFFLG